VPEWSRSERSGWTGSRRWGWPDSEAQLVDLQHHLAAAAAEALDERPWLPPAEPLVAGGFVAYARGEAGPGRRGDQAWAAAVLWRAGRDRPRRTESVLRGTVEGPGPRRATDVEAQAVVAGRVGASYAPGLLSLREGPLLAEALAVLVGEPDVVMVDATGADHPRHAGLALHLGAAVGLPSVGVTRRPLVAVGDQPPLVRGASAPVRVGPTVVGRWVCTRSGARPVLAHAGWRTDPATAAALVLMTSTPAARTPVPLQEARRVAREARSLAAQPL
jgi:deoxyribonuclease V